MVKLLAERFNGILCEENYQDQCLDQLDPKKFPALTYTKNLQDWALFIRRTPDEYEKWINDVTKECTIIELQILDQLQSQHKPIFVDTNIPVELLHEISDKDHVLIMLTDPEISVKRFFDRPDKEKQFLYQLLLKEKDPEYALNNFRECLKRINNQEVYDYYLNSGFNVLIKDEKRSIEDTLDLVCKLFNLK